MISVLILLVVSTPYVCVLRAYIYIHVNFGCKFNEAHKNFGCLKAKCSETTCLDLKPFWLLSISSMVHVEPQTHMVIIEQINTSPLEAYF